MAKNSIDSYQAEGKTNLLLIDPDNVTIVGLDCPADVCPELADPDRIDGVAPEMVDSIVRYGVVNAIQIRKLKGDERVFVVNGRQRTMGARLAKKRMLKEDPRAITPLLKCIVDGSSSLGGSNAVAVVANELNRADSPLAKARKAERMAQYGHDAAAICAAFGVTGQTLVAWRALLSVHPEVIAKVEAGTVAASTAIALSKLPHDEQVSKLEEAIEAEGRDGGAVRERLLATTPTKSKKAKSEKKADPKEKAGPAWTQKDMVRLRDYIDPKKNVEGEVETDVQRALFHALRVMTGEVDVSKARGLAEFGGLKEWMADCGPRAKKAKG